MENAEVAKTFSELADLLELTGGNPYKVRAYRQAAQVIDTLPSPVSELWRRGELTSIASIGERIASRIGQLLERGTLPDRDELAGRVPEGVVELLSIEGVGPKTVAAAWRTLGIADVDGLEQACRSGRLAALPRLGERRLRVLPPEAFGAALHYFTGSKAHNIAIRTRAVHRGLKLSEYGVFDREGRRLSGAREEDVFEAVGLPWIPPELREGAGEIEAAEAGTLPRLVEERDVLGDLHVHSRASTDARATLEELADEAGRRGRRYLAITDHSRSRPLGLDEEGLAEQRERIAALNRERGEPRLLAGVEVDILPDGSLDLPTQALAGLDWVVASVHADFTQPRERMTDRIIRALRSGVVDVLGHPTGRRIGHRDAYQLDLEAVLEVAREEGVALEVNAMPERLDLSDRACRLAKEAGVRVAISTDAHVAAHLSNIRNGVWVARRGWLGPEDVMNTRALEELWRVRRRH